MSLPMPIRPRWTLFAPALLLLSACEHPAGVRAGLEPSPVEQAEALAARLGVASGPKLSSALLTLERLAAEPASVQRPAPGAAANGLEAEIRALDGMRDRLPSREAHDAVLHHARRLDARLRAAADRDSPAPRAEARP